MIAALQTLTVFVLVCVGVVLAYLAIMSLVTCRPPVRVRSTTPLLLVGMFVICGPVFLAWQDGTIYEALSVASLLGFVCALVAFYLGQRFESPVRSSNLVVRRPSLLPNTALVYFSFSIVFLVASADAVWAVLPVAVWALVGVACAELAIGREVRRASLAGRHYDRSGAIFALNSYRGRAPSMFAPDRSGKYPFP